MKLCKNFGDFLDTVNEGYYVTKKKYGERNAEVISSNAPVRNKVLSFVAEKGQVSEKEMKEFLNSLEEAIGKKPSRSWLTKNKGLLSKETSESGESVYTLSSKGKKILELYGHDSKGTVKLKNNSDLENAKALLRKNKIEFLDEAELLDDECEDDEDKEDDEENKKDECE